MAAVLRAASRGIRGSETETTARPAAAVVAATTVSPLPVNAMPRQSKPRPEVRGRAGRVGRGAVHPATIRIRGRTGRVGDARATIDRMATLTLVRPRLLDRYIVREMIAPTSLGLLVFTFILLIDQIPRLLAILVARSADLWTIVRVFLNLLPSILAVTVPMAFLLGVLLAFGRLASDSEIVALRAAGVSPLRLLGPVAPALRRGLLLTLYINAVALPAANQAHRELVFNLVVTQGHAPW